MRAAAVGLLVCLFAGSLQLAGADEAKPVAGEDKGVSLPIIIVTQDADVDPPACRPYRVAARAVRFMEALATANRRALLGRFWGSDFKSFSLTTGPGQGFSSADHGDSPERTFKALRKRGGIQMRLTEIQVFVGPGGARRGVRVNPVGFWLPPGGGPEVPIPGGKTRVRCDSPRIALWNVAARGDIPPLASCPPPPEPPPEGVETLIACAVAH